MEPAQNNTNVDLKEYFNDQIKHLKETFTQGREEILNYFNAQLNSHKESVKAIEYRLQQYFDLKIHDLDSTFRDYKIYIEQKLKEMNEFRGALNDVIKFQSSTKDLEGAVKTVEAENKHLVELINTKADAESVLFKIKVNDEAIRQLEKYRATMEGKASQTSVLIALAISLIGIILTLINMFK